MSQAPPQGGPDVAALAEELQAIRRRVLNVVGHELRTPVTMLHGLAVQACAASDLETVTDTIGPAMVRAAQRLTVLLDDLLVAAGIQTAIPTGIIEPVELVDLVCTCWESMSSEPIEVDAHATVLHLSRIPLQRAVEAVLDNALAYGLSPPQIGIRVVDGDAVLTVHSPGPSPDPEEVRLATEVFFRGEHAVTTRPGLGVGLTIAEAMIRHLGGRLQFAGSGSGVMTTISLPIAADPRAGALAGQP